MVSDSIPLDTINIEIMAALCNFSKEVSLRGLAPITRAVDDVSTFYYEGEITA